MGLSFARCLRTHVNDALISSRSPFISLAGARACQAQAQDTGDAQLATVKQYCAGCHNDKAKIGGVSFEGITAASVAKNPELFEKAVRKLRGRVMPPPGAKQPDGKAVDSLVAWLEDSLDKVPSQAHVTDQAGAAPAESQGVRKRGPRSASGRRQRRRTAAAGRHRAGLRQHRVRAAGFAILYRAIRPCRP